MNTKESNVAKVVIEVDALANLGIFNKELLIIRKLILVRTANTIAKINFQLIISRIIFSMFKRLPEINERSPSKTIENVFAIQ